MSLKVITGGVCAAQGFKAAGIHCGIKANSKPDKNDRRVRLVSLTEKGKRFDREHLTRILESDRRATKDFTAEEEAMLVSLLTRMYNNLKEGQER